MKVKNAIKNDNSDVACTVLRAAAERNMVFYSQAGKKARIFIEINAVMITVFAGAVVRLSVVYRPAVIPLIGQSLVSTVVILLSLRANQPAHALIPKDAREGETYKIGANSDKIDLLHFGEEAALEIDEFFEGMMQMMGDADSLYRNFTQSLYFQAQVLGRKYRYLRLAVGVFLAGLTVNILVAIGIAFYG